MCIVFYVIGEKMPNIFGIIIVTLILVCAGVSVIQLIIGDFSINGKDGHTPLVK